MNRAIRLLDFGAVSPARSQAVYHGLAAVLTSDSPDTIVFLRPNAPYFCVGFHQDPAEELDLAWCRRRGYPVLHRRIGGGTVYLDQAQLFYQCIFHRSRAPFDVASIYRRFLGPPVEGLRRLGLDAQLTGINEIEVGSRRIAGTGGGQLGEAVVVVGNLLFGFSYDLMTRAWKVPSKAFRRLAAEGLRGYVTTLERELVRQPSMAAVQDLLRTCYEDSLASPVIPGSLGNAEHEAIARAEVEFSGGLTSRASAVRPRGGIKIAGHTYVRECARQTVSGSLRVTARVRNELIDALRVSPRRWRSVARVVEGSQLEPQVLFERVNGHRGGSELVETLLAMNGTGRSG